jgi:hypothetical protein
MAMDQALCPYCGTFRPLQAIVPGDLACERRLDPHFDPAQTEPGYRPIIGTCPGSSLIESRTGEAERQRVLEARAQTAERMATLTVRPSWPEYGTGAWFVVPFSVPLPRAVDVGTVGPTATFKRS